MIIKSDVGSFSDNTTIEEELPYVNSSDGQWIKPFFDCGGSNEWIFAFSVPVLFRNQTSGKIIVE